MKSKGEGFPTRLQIKHKCQTVSSLLVQNLLKKVPLSSEHHAELKHQTPVPPSFASALLSLNKQRPFTYSPTIKRDLLERLHYLPTYLLACSVARTLTYLLFINPTITIGLIIRLIESINQIVRNGKDSKPEDIASIFFMIISILVVIGIESEKRRTL